MSVDGCGAVAIAESRQREEVRFFGTVASRPDTPGMAPRGQRAK